MAGVFNYRFKEDYPDSTCVVRYWFGKKYFIWKAMRLYQGTQQVMRDLNYKLTKAKIGTLLEDDQFYHVAKYCNKARVNLAIVEVLFSSNDKSKILQFDQDELSRTCSDPDCLNLCGESYIPAWLKETTSNKALQSHISPSDDIHYVKRSDIKPRAKSGAIEPVIADVQSGDLNSLEILKQIRASKSK